MSVSDREPLTPDDVFEILSNHRRRMVLYYLRQHGDSAGVKELAEEIAAMENDVPVDELTSQQRKRVYVSLYQTHLPKMAETNVIDYDKDEGIVSLTDQTSDIDQYLTTSGQPTYPWRTHYAILTALGGTVLILSLLEAPLFVAFSPLWTAVGLLVLYVSSGLLQYWYRQQQASEVPIELSQYEQ